MSTPICLTCKHVMTSTSIVNVVIMQAPMYGYEHGGETFKCSKCGFMVATVDRRSERFVSMPDPDDLAVTDE